MKNIYILESDSFKIISHTAESTVDPQKTLLSGSLSFSPVPGCIQVSDTEAAQIEEKIISLGPNKKLCFDGSTVDDFRGTSYYEAIPMPEKGLAQYGFKLNQLFPKKTIRGLNKRIPAGAFPSENIPEEFLKKVQHQKEVVRIYKLSPEAREKEKKQQIISLKREALNMKEMAALDDENFDPKSWLEPRIKELDAKYMF